MNINHRSKHLKRESCFSSTPLRSYKSHAFIVTTSKEQPQCVGCDAPFTVRHFLLECGDFAQVRNNCFHVENMKQLFQDIHIDGNMTFFK